VVDEDPEPGAAVKASLGILPRAQIGVSRWRRFRATVDFPLVFTVLAIAAIGLFNLYSATHGTRHAAKFDKQVNWMIVGASVFVVATVVDYRTWVRLAWIGLGSAIVLLIVVQLVGDSAYAKGSYRWFDLGSFRVQPSEPAKLAIIIALARMLQDTDVTRYSTEQLVLRVAALLAPVLLIAMQPDLGTSVLIVLFAMTVGYLMMQNLWPMIYATLVTLLAVPILWETMHEYQKSRLVAFLDPSAYATGAGWHTLQSIAAVGSGKIWGKGYQEGTQNQFDFLPEHWTDFPFSVWAEEWGFVGSVAVIGLFSFLLLWILNVAVQARDRAGAVICCGVAAMTFWHVFVNIAMVLGVAPVVGVTLPLISYGGSSVITFWAAMGLVASVSLRKHGY
jgi:rod shape determining protein RodA